MNFQRLQKEQYDDGYRSGLKDGEARGRDELTYMQPWLHEQGRDDDVMRTITDKTFCMKMLEEYRSDALSDRK